ncbi:hypothetical protein K466DRAFT_652006 [Polyporus arcularius HHB13444]|uniref:F-box domain-containing protein n=1 Tax=Polyporus arcularius HHB13444 TaxID=1314778 RepID=A0A5C3PKZ8_9APHY|nr:hypothetical protein K466DRAFT_652006 [Polyporus arcularius HHB13444]
MSGSTVESGHFADHAPPNLPFDIFAILLQLLDKRADVKALMLTSKDICAEGARRLLQFPITIPDDKRLVSFCRFILRDTPHRAPNLRQLHICIALKLRHYAEEYRVYANDPDLHGASLLVRVLKAATGLADLSIDWCEELLEREHRLVSSIASLSSLRSLRVSSVGLLSCELLHTMRSYLRTLEVDCWMHDVIANHYDDLPLPYLLDTLPTHCCHTLQTLIVWFSDVRSRHNSEEWCQALRFPGVRTLSLRNPTDLDREFLVRAFPKLVRLDIMDVLVEEVDMEEIRTDNLEQACWHNLEELSGDVDSLFALGLTSPVRRVDIVCPNDFYSTRRRLHEVLSGTRPTHLLLHFAYSRHEEEEGCAPDGGVADILYSDTLAEKVTHFALDISLNMQTDIHSPNLLRPTQSATNRRAMNMTQPGCYASEVASPHFSMRRSAQKT